LQWRFEKAFSYRKKIT